VIHLTPSRARIRQKASSSSEKTFLVERSGRTWQKEEKNPHPDGGKGKEKKSIPYGLAAAETSSSRSAQNALV